MRHWILAGAALAIAGSALGAERMEPSRDQKNAGPPPACKADIPKLCADVKPGAGRILRCLDQHRDAASKACKAALGGGAAGPGAGGPGAGGKGGGGAGPGAGGKGGDQRNGKGADQGKSKVDTYGILEFVMVTGSDDLRGDSTAWAVVKRPNGRSKTCVLKSNGQDSWGNDSSHTVTCELATPLTLANLQKTRIVIGYNGTSGNPFEGQDNWNLNGVTINAYNQDHKPICIFSTSGNPIHRFQGVNGGSVGTNDSIVVTDLPSRCR